MPDNGCCPHCGAEALLRDNTNQVNGEGRACLMCSRGVTAGGQRHISAKKELQRGCCDINNRLIA